tara:strand:- start:580 stop:1014 length:435 start_codon:yes stop_codon:yes gene_type:complete
MFGRRSKKKGSMQKFLEKKGAIGGKSRGGMNAMFRSRTSKPMKAPTAAGSPKPSSGLSPFGNPLAPRPVSSSRGGGGGLLRTMLKIQNAMGGGSAANAQGVGASIDRKLSQSPFGNALAPKPAPGLRREMDKVNRRRPQRYGAK